MTRCCAFLLAVAGLVAVGRPATSDAPHDKRPANQGEVKRNLRELIIGKWRLVDPEVKQTVEFSKDGALKLTISHMLANGKPVALMKDGKPREGTLNGHYKVTGDSTIEGEVENLFHPSGGSKTLPFRLESVSVSKDQLTLPGQRTFVPVVRTADYRDDSSGKVTKYERVK